MGRGEVHIMALRFVTPCSLIGADVSYKNIFSVDDGSALTPVPTCQAARCNT